MSNPTPTPVFDSETPFIPGFIAHPYISSPFMVKTWTNENTQYSSEYFYVF